MRTTVDLPDDVHRIAVGIARDSQTSLSETVTRLIRRAIGIGETATVSTSARTGIETITLGRTITSEDVRDLDDDS